MTDHQIIFVMALAMSTFLTLLLAGIDWYLKPRWQKRLSYNYLTIWGLFMCVFYVPNALFYWSATRGI